MIVISIAFIVEYGIDTCNFDYNNKYYNNSNDNVHNICIYCNIGDRWILHRFLLSIINKLYLLFVCPNCKIINKSGTTNNKL